MANSIRVTLIGKPGCHLCDDARLSLNSVIDDFQAANPSALLEVTELNILTDPELALRHSEEIPVVLINGKMHSYWHVDPVRLKAALTALG